jgi:cell wall-associated NlpC family hydrolase
MREHLVNLALKLVGCPYIWGGQNPWTGFDCSGFIIWIYQVFGLLPSGDWTAQGIENALDHQDPPSVTDLKPGDLVFYGPAREQITHVMLYAGGGLVVGASGGGHLTTTREEAAKKGAQVKVKPWKYRSDAQTFLHVKFPGE